MAMDATQARRAYYFIMTSFTFVPAVSYGCPWGPSSRCRSRDFLCDQDAATRNMEVNASKASLVYRQVSPADTVFMRSAVEGFLGCIVALLLLAGSGLLGFNVT
jgi:hypothetical protein